MPGAEAFLIEGLGTLPGGFGDAKARVRLHGTSLFSLYRVSTRHGDLAAKLMQDETMARTEADGLEALGAAGARAPEVFGTYAKGGRVALYMEFVDAAGSVSGTDLIGSLERLYGARRERWGLDQDNFIGTLPQTNGLFDDFADFWWEARIRPMAERARSERLLTPDHLRRLREVVYRRSEEWRLNALGPRLVHGDLWSGNVLSGKAGAYLIDPSVAASHPEQDFGMLQMFGSPVGMDPLDALGRRLGCAPGLAKRIPFWQIYPLLVHVNIFGSSYMAGLERALRTYE